MSASALFVTRFDSDGWGAGQALIAVHGVQAHGLRFVRLAALLPGVRVVAPDLRGHGRSPKVPPWTVAQHVRDLLPLLANHGGPAVVLGHSFGGLIAWELARAAPERVSHLVLVDPAIAVSAEVAAGAQREAAPERRWPSAVAALQAGLANRSSQAAWSVALDVAAGMQVEDDGSLRELVALDAVRAAWDDMRRPLNPSRFGGPALLLEAGLEQGRYVSAALVDALRSQLGDRLSHVALDAPHTIPADAPELLAGHLRRFLAG